MNRRVRVVDDRFEIVARAAQGGMGTVYRARDRRTDLAVALKVLHRLDREGALRFQKEAELLATLDHPGIVRHVAHGTLPDDRAWIAMQWLEGEELRRRLLSRGLDLDGTLAMGRKVAEALGAIHADGIVHRDVKPSNIMLVGEDPGQPCLIDFGIARMSDYGPDPMTRTGIVLGTMGYLAPEQARGEREIGPPADVFSLGVVLYRCLTGKAPFDAPNPAATLAKVLLEEPAPVHHVRPELPSALGELVRRMLSKDPDRRPADGKAVAEGLARVAVGQSSPAIAASDVLTTGERRLVAVIVARPAPTMGALEQDERDRIAAFGGKLDSLADGSAVVSLSGRGTAGDLAAQASRCALALRRDWEGPMVLATGRAGGDGKLPFGEVIDDAWQLFDRPPQRGVALDPTTAGLLDERFDVVRAAGKHVLRREVPSARGARTLLGIATPCVGRDRELALLRGLYEASIEGPEARAILVCAPSGTGKSRLRAEFLDRLPPGATVWMARGDALRAGSPFALVAELVRGALGVAPGPRAVEHLLAALERRFSPEEAAEHAAFLGELIDVPFPVAEDPRLAAARSDPMLMGDRMELAFEALVQMETQRRPLVIVLEDLQWGDMPTVRWIDRALRLFDERPMLVLALGRPEVREVFPRLWADRRMEELHLGGIGRRAAGRLVRAVLGDAAGEEDVAALISRADGNAFYLEELIRARATGVERLPESVLAMAQSRVESLEPEARRILRAASVFGGSAWKGGIAALLGVEVTGDSLDRWLETLAGRELLTPVAEGQLAGDADLVFRHDLVREAAYAMLTEADRARGHRAAGAWLSAAGAQDPLVLAGHFDLGGDAKNAARWYRVAAEAALEGNDLEAVRAIVEKALGVGEEPEEEGRLRLLLAEAHRWRGALSLAETASLQAMRLLPRGSAAFFRAAGELGEVLGALSRKDELADLATEVRDIAPDPGAAAARSVAIARMALPLLYAGRYALAEALLVAAAQDDALLARDPLARGHVYRALGIHANFRGEGAAALVVVEQTLAAFAAAGDGRNRCRALNSLGFTRLELGRYVDAEAALVTCIQESERLGLGATAALARQNLGYARARRGELADGARLVEASFAALESIGNARLAAGSELYLAWIRREQDDPGSALVIARDGEARLGATNEPGRAFARALQAGALLDMGRTAEALAASESAFELLQRLGAVDEGEALVRLTHAKALLAVGRVHEARQVAIAAQERLRARAMRIHDPELRRSFLEEIAEHRDTLTFR